MPRTLEEVVSVLQYAVLLFLDVLGYVIVARCILSLFASEDSKLLLFCYAVSEPVVAPVRRLLERIPALEDFPIDFSYVATFLFLTVVRTVLLSVV